MKKLILFLVVVLLTSCDFSSLFKTKIEEIITQEYYNVYVGQTINLEIQVKPEKKTIPDFKFTFDDGAFDMNVKNYSVTGKKIGEYLLTINDEFSNITEYVTIRVFDVVSDFNVIQSVYLANTDSRFSLILETIPTEGVKPNYEYSYDKTFLSYDSINDSFMTLKKTGETQIQIFEKECQKTKTVDVSINNDIKRYQTFEVEIDIKTQLPDEVISDIANHDLRVSYEVDNGLIYEAIDNSVCAAIRSNWTITFYKSTLGEDIIFGELPIFCNTLKIYDPIQLHFGIKTPLPDEVIADIATYDLRVVYNVDTGLVYESIDNSVCASIGGNWTVSFYRPTLGEDIIFGELSIFCITLKEYEPFQLHIGIKTSLPDEVLADIATHNLTASYEVNNGLVYEAVDNSVFASLPSNWTITFYKHVLGENIIFAKLPVFCQEWLKIEFLWGQRLRVDSKEVLTDQDEIIPRIKNETGITFKYQSSSRKLYYIKTLSEKDICRDLGLFGGAQADFPEKCADKGVCQDYETITSDTNQHYAGGKSYNAITSDTSLSSTVFFREVEAYSVSVHCTQAYVSSWAMHPDCHAGNGNAGGPYNHPYFRLPYQTINEYNVLIGILDKHFQDQKARIIKDFTTSAPGQTYELEGFQLTQANSGTFKIKKNQANKEYLPDGFGNEENVRVHFNELNNTTTPRFEFIKHSVNSLNLIKQMSTIREPDFPIVRKVYVKWAEGVNFIDIIPSNIPTHTIIYNDEIMADRVNRTAYITIQEKDLTNSNNNCVLNGQVGTAKFIINGIEFVRSLHVIQEDF